MSDAATNLLIMLAEGMRHAAQNRVNSEREEAARGGNFITGYAKSIRNEFTQDAEKGEAWIAKLDSLLAELKAIDGENTR